VPTSRVSHVARVCKALRHYRGEWLARDPLRGIYKVPLASENPLQFMGRALARIPRLIVIAAKSTREPPYKQLPYCPCPFRVR
jgi:hypothetical protein